MIHGRKTLDHLLQPLAAYLDRQGVNEIVVNEPGRFGIEQNGLWTWHICAALDYDWLDALGIVAGNLMGKRFDPAHPVCLTTLPGEQQKRLTLIQPPAVTAGTISMTIRIPSKSAPTIHDADFIALMQAAETYKHQHDPVDDELLRLYDAKEWRAFFDLAIISKKTIGVTGTNKSGKTTYLKRLMRAVPAHERLITIEDTPEFGGLPLQNRVALFFGSDGVTAELLIETTLRMAASRIAMQELRGPEAYAFVRLQAAGQPGSLTTWHADMDNPFEPLKLMVKQHDAGRHVPDPVLENILRSFIDIVVHCNREERADGPPIFSVPKVYFRHAKGEE